MDVSSPDLFWALYLLDDKNSKFEIRCWKFELRCTILFKRFGINAISFYFLGTGNEKIIDNDISIYHPKANVF